jgi:outer membrane receptor protein involved in Fe transport
MPSAKATQIRRLTAIALGIAVLATLTRTAAAQSTSRPSLTGVVADPTGAVLPNASVEVHMPTGVVAQTTTDSAGRFKVDHLARGTYDVVVTFEGFQPTTVHVVIDARAPTPLRVVMPLAGVTQEVTVSNQGPQVSIATVANRDAVTADDKTLADLPQFDQDFVATMSRFLDSAAIGTGGVTLVVKGMEANGLGVTASAIKEIKINQNPYSAEFNRPGRGRIEVITKPGSSAFHGTVNAIFRNSTFNARPPFAAEKPAEARRIFEGYLSGPVGDGQHTSFVLSMDHDEEDQQAIVHAVGPSGLIDGIVPNPYRNSFASGSISHQQGTANTLSFRASFQYRRHKNQGVGGLTLPEAGTNNLFHELESVYTQDTIVKPTLFHQFRLLYGQYYNGTSSVMQAPAIVVQDAFTGGGAQADYLRTEHHVEVKDTLTWSPGHQTIKGGVDIPDWSRRRFDDYTNQLGTFYFGNLPAFNLARPYVFIAQRGDGRLTFLEKVLGLFVEDEIQATSEVTVTVGVRYDWQNYFHDNNDFGPRAAVAWAPGALPGTVFRVGGGLFHDRSGPGPISDLLHSEEGKLLRYVITDPGFPQPLPPGESASAEPRSLVELSPAITIPATWQYSVGVERQLSAGLTLSATYIGMYSNNLFLSRDVNAPPPPAYAARPDPVYGVVRQMESAGRLRSNAFQITLRGGITKYFRGQTQYTVATTQNSTSGINWFPANDYDPSGEYARADYDQRQRFDSLGTVKVGSLCSLSVALALYSARPYSVLAGADLYNNGRSNARPFGIARNTLGGPDYADLDVRWSRDFAIGRPRDGGDAPKVTVGIDAFNVLNRTNFTAYLGTVTSPLFGQAVAAQPPRRLQLSLRATF